MTEKPDNTPIETWFRLKDRLTREYAGDGVSVRPPSLRDACYAYVLAIRRNTETSPEIIESFVNGLELGAMEALRQAWETNERATAAIRRRQEQKFAPDD